jgi:hypothetical protein
MKQSIQRSVALLAWFVVFPAWSQGTFQNLNFEDANPVIVGSFYATAASALPFWSVTIGGVPQTLIPVNSYSTGAPWMSLQGPGAQPGLTPIDGSYSVFLQDFGGEPTVEISQTATIPAGTQSLQFEAKAFVVGLNPNEFQVLIGSEVVPITQIGQGPNYTLYGANLSAWAGQTETLSLAATGSGPVITEWELDNISFSPNSVAPEPSPLILTGIGALVFAFYRRLAPNPR